MTHHSTGAKALAWIGLLVLIAFSILATLTPTANGPTVNEDSYGTSVSSESEATSE